MKDLDLTPVPAQISTDLAEWFRRNQRDMPWRKSRDPYRIWISEIMLQQTQVAAVIPYFERWTARFPDVGTLYNAEENEVMKYWEGLGYYSRAVNIMKGAEFIIEKCGGIFPDDYDNLLKVPGIGPYTAAAVSSIAFGKADGVVDGNVKRVMARLFELYDEVTSSSLHAKCRILVERSFHNYDPGLINQAWMELGALVCTPRPRCTSCPVNAFCEAYSHNRMSEFPVKTEKAPIPTRQGAMFIIRDENGKYLTVKRRRGHMLQGLWEFPNTYYDEMPLSDFTLANDIIINSNYISRIRHKYSHFSVEFELYDAELRSGWWNDYWDDARWVDIDDLISLPKPKIQILAMKHAGIV